MADIVNLDLLSDPRSIKTIGNGIYGSVIIDGAPNELGSKLCCIKKGTCEYTGEAGEWVPHVLENDGKGAAHFVTIAGKNYVVKSINTIDRFSSFKDRDVFNLEGLRKSMIKSPDISKSCLGVLGNFQYKYVGLDNFGAEVINSAIIHDAFNKSGLPVLYNKIVSYSLCGRAGLILMEEADQTDLASYLSNLSKNDSAIYSVSLGKKGESSFPGIKREIIVPIIKQVTSCLDYLQKKIEFIHSELLANNILIDSDQCRGNYEKIKLDGPYTAKIADYSHSATSLPLDEKTKVRFFNEYRVTRFLPVTPSYELKTKTSQVCQVSIGSPSKCSDVLWWKLPTTFGVKSSLITQHSGMPFYRSYDFYTFIVSLMLCPRFYYTIMSSENADLLASVWTPLWQPKEIDQVNKLVEKNKGEKVSLSLVLDIMSGLSLRCDAIEVVIENLSKLH